MIFAPDISALAAKVLEACRARKWTIATAESCTGGLVAGALTTPAGSSDCFTQGFITYADEAKIQMLAVNAGDIATHGSVSEPVAAQMAMGALGKSRASIAVSITGIAGPGGGSEGKPVGTVHFAVVWRDNNDGTINIKHQQHRFEDIGRDAIRLDAVKTALRMILDAAQDS